MAPRSNRSQVVSTTLIYREHELSPQDHLLFIELPPFYWRWDGFELTDQDLLSLQVLLMANPTIGRVIQGTGGLRKLRFACADAGKSGGYRICYVYIPRHATVVLVLIYAKFEKDTLTAAEKDQLRVLIDEVGRLLDERFYRSG